MCSVLIRVQSPGFRASCSCDLLRYPRGNNGLTTKVAYTIMWPSLIAGQMQSSIGHQANVNQELSVELEQVLGGYLKYLLERDVKSAAWLDTLRKQRLQFRKTALP